MQIRRVSCYHFFPICAIVSLILIRFIELNYADRNPQVIRTYLFFNLLFPSVYFFLVAYLVPLFVSLICKVRYKRLLHLIWFSLMSLYVLISIYVCLIKQQPDLFPQKIDISLGILVGLILGCALACQPSDVRLNK